jgi:acetylornithine deacetylase/succinyl-diaminopimelate desuccinylase-like protein
MRGLLAQMIAVDTSHGHETTLLEPLAALYREAGVPVQVLESSPGRGNLVARLHGSGAKKPLLLLAHVDVVPVDGQPWTTPPFTATERDGMLAGRGVNDDKGMAAAIVALSLELARTHAPLARDVIVALTAGEETGGAAGVRWLLANHEDLLDAEVALNEGADLLVSDDLGRMVSVDVGVSEKVITEWRLVVKGPGGHSSLPPTVFDPVVTLARALVHIGEHRFPARVLPEAVSAFEGAIDRSPPAVATALRHAIASAPRLAPADDAVLSRDPAMNAAVRTTCVTTMLAGAPQGNVLPTTAEATVNCRILPGETREQVRAALVRLVNDPAVELRDGPDLGAGPSSPFQGEVVAAATKAAAKIFPGAPVKPEMCMGATDSRFLRNAGIQAYGVTPRPVTRAESAAGHIAHGANERTSLRWLGPSAEYFREVVRLLALQAP